MGVDRLAGLLCPDARVTEIKIRFRFLFFFFCFLRNRFWKRMPSLAAHKDDYVPPEAYWLRLAKKPRKKLNRIANRRTLGGIRPRVLSSSVASYNRRCVVASYDV